VTARVRLDPAAVDRLLADPRMRAEVEQTAQRVADAARPFAPLDTGAGRRSYRATKAKVTPTGLTATAYTWARLGHIWEWGGMRGQTVYAPLRNGALRVGLRLRLRGK
jgi:hypothetical protein